jgi:acetyltransferase-like isoleucine patch superfamily enzyme
VLKGADIGPGAIIGANAVVRGEIPENAVAVGVPARVIRTRDVG